MSLSNGFVDQHVAGMADLPWSWLHWPIERVWGTQLPQGAIQFGQRCFIPPEDYFGRRPVDELVTGFSALLDSYRRRRDFSATLPRSDFSGADNPISIIKAERQFLTLFIADASRQLSSLHVASGWSGVERSLLDVTRLVDNRVALARMDIAHAIFAGESSGDLYMNAGLRNLLAGQGSVGLAEPVPEEYERLVAAIATGEDQFFTAAVKASGQEAGDFSAQFPQVIAALKVDGAKVPEAMTGFVQACQQDLAAEQQLLRATPLGHRFASSVRLDHLALTETIAAAQNATGEEAMFAWLRLGHLQSMRCALARFAKTASRSGPAAPCFYDGAVRELLGLGLKVGGLALLVSGALALGSILRGESSSTA